jgi:hypothetical protein
VGVCVGIPVDSSVGMGVSPLEVDAGGLTGVQANSNETPKQVKSRMNFIFSLVRIFGCENYGMVKIPYLINILY